jgi:pre-mRNA-splicing helicase BRR2
MIGKAGRPHVDENSFSLLMCQSSRKSLYKRLLFEPLPIESQLRNNLHDTFNAEIVGETIEGKQDVVDYLTWTYYYRRLYSNPNYYNVTGNSSWHISSHLSDLVETIFDNLTQTGLIIIEENSLNVKPANLGRIAAHYYVRYTTIITFKTLIQNKMKQKELIEVLSSSSEFENVVVYPNDEDVIKSILSYKMKTSKPLRIYEPRDKISALLHAHFLRVEVKGDLLVEQHRRQD